MVLHIYFFFLFSFSTHKLSMHYGLGYFNDFLVFFPFLHSDVSPHIYHEHNPFVNCNLTGSNQGRRKDFFKGVGGGGGGSF